MDIADIYYKVAWPLNISLSVLLRVPAPLNFPKDES